MQLLDCQDKQCKREEQVGSLVKVFFANDEMEVMTWSKQGLETYPEKPLGTTFSVPLIEFPDSEIYPAGSTFSSQGSLCVLCLGTLPIRWDIVKPDASSQIYIASLNERERAHAHPGES